jgi:hypothetical protein
MPLKHTMSWLASGAAATAGLVWMARLLRRKPAEREEWDSPTGDAPRSEARELPKPALTFPDDIEEDFAAAADARRDIGEEPLDLDTASDPRDVDPDDSSETVHGDEHLERADEHYDAIDSDDLGTEWLFRATQSAPRERAPTPEELAERAAAEDARDKS